MVIAYGTVARMGLWCCSEFLLHAPSHLSRRGRVLLGVQPMFVSDNRIRELVEQTHLTMLNRITRCCIPSVVYVLGHTQPPPVQSQPSPLKLWYVCASRSAMPQAGVHPHSRRARLGSHIHDPA